MGEAFINSYLTLSGTTTAQNGGLTMADASPIKTLVGVWVFGSCVLQARDGHLAGGRDLRFFKLRTEEGCHVPGPLRKHSGGGSRGGRKPRKNLVAEVQ